MIEEVKIQITINEQVLRILERYDVNINQLFVLLAMYDEALDLLDIYDGDFTKAKVLIEDYQFLQMHGFIVQSNQEESPVYVLEPKGSSLVENIRMMFDTTDEEKQLEADMKKLCVDYLELWPAIKLPSGVYARVSIVEIEKKMRAFFKTYKGPFKKQYGFKVTPADVVAATKAYINRYANNGYMYMVNSSYFIQKKEKSTLADEIIASKQGIVKQENKWEKQL